MINHNCFSFMVNDRAISGIITNMYWIHFNFLLAK